MSKVLLHTLSILLLLDAAPGFAHGLRIKGNSYPIKERTAVDLFHFRSSLQHRKLVRQFSLAFDFRLDQPQGHGNLTRIKFDDPNATLNVFCRQLDNGQLEVKLVEEGLDQLGMILLTPQQFGKDQWIHLVLDLDLSTQKITWRVLDQHLVIPFPHPQLTYHNVYFGKSDFSIDVADFSIRNLSATMDHEHIAFPLKESTGNTVHSVEGNPIGQVENPTWLINESYYWQASHAVEMPETGGYQFDGEEGRLLLFDRYRLSVLDLQSGTWSHSPFSTALPIDIRLGNSFLRDGILYIYEVNDLSIGSPTMVSVDLATLEANVVSTDFVPMQLHHHTGQSTPQAPYLLFGGFGNDRYSNVFLSLDMQRAEWDTLSTTGDPIMPRYFTSSFYDPGTNSMYLFGGMGNEAADNTIGRVYRYDFYRLDLATNRLQKLWERPLTDKNIVPARNLVREDNTSSFYALMYPEYRSSSVLQLYRFSIDSGEHTLLGDTIPIRSEKIKTNANLFFHSRTNTFYAVTQVFDSAEVSSQVTVYELKAPAVSQAELLLYDEPRPTGRRRWLAGLLVVAVMAFAIVKVYKRHKNVADTVQMQPTPLPTPAQPFALPLRNAIYLFGRFEVFDKKGVNISHLFSSRLKQVLILFLSRYAEGGIESSELSNLLWPDKEVASAKNVRGVTLNQFRKLLANLTGIALVFQDNHYRLQVADCFVDYLEISEAHRLSQLSNGKSQAILQRGKFLKTTEHELLDDIKDEVDRIVVEALQQQLRAAFVQGNYERVIQVARLCLETAPTDLRAFQYEIRAMLHLKNRTEALRRFEHFSQFYQGLMNEPLPLAFEAIDKQRP